VTGGAGFIGSHLVDVLVARGDTVVVVDDLTSGARAKLAHVQDRITFIHADVRELSAHAGALAGVSVVFHLAALISSHDSLLEPQRYLDANIGGVLALLQATRGMTPLRIVLASSSTVYGAREGGTCSEADLPRPITPYAISKLTGEHLLATYAARDGISWCALRLFNVYGPRQSPDHAYANVTCRFTHAALARARVPLFGDGTQTRDFVHVDDVVAALLAAGDSDEQGAINVGTGVDHSIRDLVALLERLTGAPLLLDRRPAWPNDIPALRADTRLLRERLDVTPTVTLEAGIARLVQTLRSEAR
jgi:UDP-glucose 4-epimerase